MKRFAVAAGVLARVGFLASLAIALAGNVRAGTISQPFLSIESVLGVPEFGVVQFGDPSPTDLTLIMRVSLAPDQILTIGALFIHPFTGGGTIPGPELDVTLLFNGVSITPEVAHGSPSDLFFISLSDTAPGDQISYSLSIVGRGGFIALFDVPPLSGQVSEPGALLLVASGLGLLRPRKRAAKRAIEAV